MQLVENDVMCTSFEEEDYRQMKMQNRPFTYTFAYEFLRSCLKLLPDHRRRLVILLQPEMFYKIPTMAISLL
jgi:hypothetical protein